MLKVSTCVCPTLLQPLVVCVTPLNADAELATRPEEERVAAVAAVEKKMPRAVKRKRRVVTEDGIDAGMEEYLVCLNPPFLFSACVSGRIASVLAATVQRNSMARCLPLCSLNCH